MIIMVHAYRIVITSTTAVWGLSRKVIFKNSLFEALAIFWKIKNGNPSHPV